MIFNTYWFICFSAVFFPVYWLLFLPGLRRAWLIAGCAVFHYHFAGPAGVIPIVVIGLATYLLALTRRRLLCAVGIALSVAALCFYKYALFLSTDVLGAVYPAGAVALANSARAALPGAAPLAISFFAFEFVHYLVEVGRGREPIRRPDDFVLFAIHFPSLVAGPIKRYYDYLPSLRSGLARVTVEDVAAGLQRIALGLVKKIILADNLTLALNFYGDRGRPSMDALLAFARRHDVGRIVRLADSDYPTTAQLRQLGPVEQTGGVAIAPACGTPALTRRPLPASARIVLQEQANATKIQWCLDGYVYQLPAGLDPGNLLEGATKAVYVQGRAHISCDAPPDGFVQRGYAPTRLHVPPGTYPYYVRG